VITLGQELDGRVSYGDVFTRRWVVETLVDRVGYDRARDLTRLVLVETLLALQRLLLDPTLRLVHVSIWRSFRLRSPAA
jgi:hypothetical protein